MWWAVVIAAVVGMGGGALAGVAVSWLAAFGGRTVFSDIATAPTVGELPIGKPLGWHVRVPRRRMSPGIYIITAPGCVGTARIAKEVPASLNGLPVTWIVMARTRPVALAAGAMTPGTKILWAPIRDEQSLTLLTPQALYLGPDKCIWRRAIVPTLARFREFAESCPITTVQGLNPMVGC